MNHETDIQILITAYDPGGDPVGPLYEARNIEASFVLNDVGALRFTYNKAAPLYGVLTADYAEVSLQTVSNMSRLEPFGGRFIRTGYEHDVMQAVGDVTFTFVSWGWLLQKLCLWNGSLDANGYRTFTNVTPGNILRTFIEEAKTRNTLSKLSYDFSSNVDSQAAAWAKSNITIGYKPGTDLASVLRDMVSYGWVDWTTNNRLLKVYNPGTTLARGEGGDPRTGTPRAIVLSVFRPGLNLLEVQDQVDDSLRASSVLAFGDENRFAQDGLGTTSPWGVLEKSVSVSGVKDHTTLYGIASQTRASVSSSSTQRTAKVVWGYRVPLKDFRPGDYIGTLPRGGGWPSIKWERIIQITIQVQDDGLAYGSMVLNDRREEQRIKVARVAAALGQRAK